MSVLTMVCKLNLAKLMTLLLFICLPKTFSQNYYPLSVSNKWYYESSTVAHKEFFVEKDTLLSNGNKYFKLNKPDLLGGQYLRVDSEYVYYYDQNDNKEAAFFKINGEVGDYTEPFLLDYGKVEITSIETTFVFGVYTKIISYDLHSWALTQIKLSEKFGIIKALFYNDPPNPWPWYIYDITGCKISDTTYGTLVSINAKEELISEFNLYQNYPNPFNPTTKISFTIPNVVDALNASTTFVSLIVYDILGREIPTLINKENLTGYNEVEFDASNLSSGVYFYRLSFGEYSMTKKMLLIK